MNILYGLIVISLIVALVFLTLFIISVKNGQFDDDYTPSVRMLFDDELTSNKKSSQKKVKKLSKSNQTQ
jgi:cbb3-type cytochrome oxidase maturation protein